jgi:glycosyltransferase involved in cell wall biosynthesis
LRVAKELILKVKKLYKHIICIASWKRLIKKYLILIRNYKYKLIFFFTLNKISNIKSNKKIIVVTHNANKEGASLLALNIVKNLKNNFGFEVITIGSSGGVIQEDFEMYSTFYRWDLLEEKELKKLCINLYKNGFEKAICNTVTVGNIVEILSLHGIECTTLVHELPYVIEALNKITSLNLVGKFSKNVIFPAKYNYEKLQEKYNFNVDSVSIFPQGRYMKNNYRFNKKDAREKLRNILGLDIDKKIVLGVGSGEYRKGLDLFIGTGKVLAHRTENIQFVWVGPIKDDISREAIKRIKKNGLIEKFSFINYSEDIALFYSGADVFYLSSREDPFPSVFIDAVSINLPVVAFKDSGGFQDMQQEIGGVLVEKENILKAADEIIKIINKGDEELEPSDNVNNLMGFNSYISNILNVAKLEHPKISVILPNYNYEKYIRERLESIFNQTIKPIEIVFLDDKSQDNSLSIAKLLLENSGIDYQIIANKENEGCYSQWSKGIKASRGDLIWIAEADDLCEPNFLEETSKFFSDEDVTIAFSQSIAIDENSKVMNYSYLDYTSELSDNRWKKDYTNDGRNEVEEYFSRMNIIPNASGALLKKSALYGVERELTKYKACGDWFLYIYALSKGKISFNCKPLNFHRRHSNSIIHKVMHNDLLLKDIIQATSYIYKNYKLSEESKNSLAKRYSDYYSLITRRMPRLSEDKVFNSYFVEMGIGDLWGKVVDYENNR